MKRFTAILVFAGAVIVSTHILAPAAPTSPQFAARPAEIARAHADQTAPILEEMNAQVDKLRERLSAPPEYPAPTRDPFRFGKIVEPSRPKLIVPAVMTSAVPPPAPAPALPRLVAITSRVVDGVTVRTAVLAMGDDLQMIKVGETVSRLVIRNIGADVVELADPASGTIFRISLQ